MPSVMAPRKAPKQDQIPDKRDMGRHRVLLTDQRVKSWWDAKSLRSRLSADNYLRQLGQLCEELDLTPISIMTLARKNPEKLRDLLVQEAARQKEAGNLDVSIGKLFNALKAYFKFHRVVFDGFPSLSPIKGASLSAERTPTPEELGVVLEKLSLRGRCVALFMAHSGVRPGVLGAYQGEGGLRLRDLPDLKLGKKPAFKESPFVVNVPAALSKTRVSYVTFGSSQLSSTFLAYLEERKRGGETLGPESPVIATNPTRGAASHSQEQARFSRGFLTTKAVVEEVRDALHSSVPEGIRWRAYVLRCYASTRLLMAEGAGKITRDLRESILGHDLGDSGRYTLGKTWGAELLKEAREQYGRSEPFLTTGPSKSADETKTSMARVMLIGLGYTEEELESADLLNPEVFQELVRNKVVPREAKLNQKLVEAQELPRYLEEGWTVVTSLNGHQVVLNPPGP